jgi:aldehyde:ferredoxin oxidoreductase
MNPIAFINLSTQKVVVKPIPEKLRLLFLGGRGINMYLLYNYLREGLDPLSPDNPLIFGAGLLTGTHGMATARFNISAKSPESGNLGDSNSGGFFGPELRFAGYDHLLIQGRSPSPVYLWIHDGEIEFKDGSHLKEYNLPQTLDAIRAELGDPDIQVAAIGSAGRKLVAFSNVMCTIGNAAGRTGMGTVMGSKNLWAIAVRGKQPIQIDNPERLMKAAEKQYRQITQTKGYKATSLYGTLMRLAISRTQGQEPALNYQYNMLESGGEEFDPEVFIQKYEYGKMSCFNCPVHTKHLHRVPSGEHKGLTGSGPEYGGAGYFGSSCGTGDWVTIMECWDLCNQYGLDILTTAGYIAWVMELYQRELIDESITGMPIRWGDHDAMTSLIHQMGRREGFGGILSDGWQKANLKLFGEKAKEYERYIPTIKGMTVDQDTRGTKAMAIGAATASRGGGCHLRSRFTMEEMDLPPEATKKIIGRPVPSDPDSYEGKAYPAIWMEKLCAVGDALGICRFVTKWLSPGLLGLNELAEAVSAVTGYEFTPEKLMEIGRRISNLERLFLIREGLDRKDDRVPERFHEPWQYGYQKGSCIDKEKFETLLDEYYREQGWDAEGIPTRETLERLELAEEPSHLL